LRVPFGDLKSHYQAYKSQIDSAVGRVLTSGHYVLGPEVERFERDFEAYLGSPYVIGCASGTEAIYLALAAAGVAKGDEVLVVAHTAVPTISAISMTGATPVFVDIEAATCVMDLDDVEAKISIRTKAIVPVHLYGQMVPIKPLMELARKHGLTVIEDCAQSTGATQDGTICGITGDFGAFSFYPSKNLGAFGDGGAVCTNSRESYDALVMLRNYGQSKRYHHEIVGINSRLDEIQAAILSAQLPFLPEWNHRRRQIAERYTAGLHAINDVQTPVEAQGNMHVYHLYVIQTRKRDELQSYLLDNGIQTLIHYPIPSHLQNAYGYLGGKPGQLPGTERVTKRILSLPMHQGLEDEQVDAVIEAICEFHHNASSVASESAAAVSRV
jgi:dTDP-4-amino-4,6-dideoxygalactose transaminase